MELNALKFEDSISRNKYHKFNIFLESYRYKVCIFSDEPLFDFDLVGFNSNIEILNIKKTKLLLSNLIRPSIFEIQDKLGFIFLIGTNSLVYFFKFLYEITKTDYKNAKLLCLLHYNFFIQKKHFLDKLKQIFFKIFGDILNCNYIQFILLVKFFLFSYFLLERTLFFSFIGDLFENINHNEYYKSINKNK
jgi:hypothetical protein